jgi:hypothetical protein
MFIEKTTSSGLFWELDEKTHKVSANEEGDIDISSPYTGRSYELFGLMAGVRGINNLYSPRGIPQNCSLPISLFWEKEENWCHSPSYLSVEEYIECLANTEGVLYSPNDEPKSGEEVKLISDKYGFTSFTDFARRMIYLEKSNPGEQVRLVFWFDS